MKKIIVFLGTILCCSIFTLGQTMDDKYSDFDFSDKTLELKGYDITKSASKTEVLSDGSYGVQVLYSNTYKPGAMIARSWRFNSDNICCEIMWVYSGHTNSILYKNIANEFDNNPEMKRKTRNDIPYWIKKWDDQYCLKFQLYEKQIGVFTCLIRQITFTDEKM